MTNDQLALLGVPTLKAGTPMQQSLFGAEREIRIPAELRRQWVDDENVRARYYAKFYVSDLLECGYWYGAITDSGHGSFRAASLPGPTRRGTIPAHLYGYELRHGIIPRLTWSPRSHIGSHICDEPSCQADHLRIGDVAENTQAWSKRRRNPRGPLADLRGPAGRARAIATAIKQGLAAGEDDTHIVARIIAAQEAGLPLTLW
jgi:hypothetical protein